MALDNRTVIELRQARDLLELEALAVVTSMPSCAPLHTRDELAVEEAVAS